MFVFVCAGLFSKRMRVFFHCCTFFCLDTKESKNQGCGCFATRSLHSAVHIANSRFALKQRCSRPLRSGRSLYAHQPRPILLSLAFGIGAFFKSCLPYLSLLKIHWAYIPEYLNFDNLFYCGLRYNLHL